MLPLLILVAIATPMLEIAVISQLLVWAPWPLVLALVVVGTVTGLVVMRQDGLHHLRDWRTARRRRSAADVHTITEGLRDVAGILLAVPGVVTTVVGLVLLAHPVRVFAARRVVAADASRRRRRLPSIEVDTTPALPPAAPPRALKPAAAAEEFESAAWDEFAMAHAPASTGYIAGQSETHDAVVDTFFDPLPPSTQVSAPPTIPDAPPLPDFLPPPEQFVPTAAGEHSEAPGAGPEWGSFMEGRDWEDEPERRRGRRAGKRKRGKGGEASPPAEGQW